MSNKISSSLNLRLIAIACIAFTLMCCGPSAEERHAKYEQEQSDLARKMQEKEKRAIEQITNKYNAVYFQPKDLGSYPYTYEIQMFFKKYKNMPILFKGYLEDIEETERGPVVEFLCPMGEFYMYSSDKKGIRFRLAISENDLKQFLKGKRPETWMISQRYWFEPDYFVVAKIDKIKGFRMYWFDGTAHEEEVEIDSNLSVNVLSTGMFIGAVNATINN